MDPVVVVVVDVASLRDAVCLLGRTRRDHVACVGGGNRPSSGGVALSLEDT